MVAANNPVLQLFTKRIYKVLLRALLKQPYINKLQVWITAASTLNNGQNLSKLCIQTIMHHLCWCSCDKYYESLMYMCMYECMYACRHILSISKGKSGTYPQRFAWARWSFSNLLQYIRNCIGQWSLSLLRERNDIYSSYLQYNAHTAHQLSFADDWKLLWDIWIEIHLCMYILLVHVYRLFCSSKNESTEK